ncbi:MAG: hypothetical protein ACU841_05415 [Gammaproteobacteria bacterium]
MKRQTCCVLSLALVSVPVTADELAGRTYGRIVSGQGEIRLPTNYRQSRRSHLGSWQMSEPKAPGHGFHDVYTQPEAVESFENPTLKP